MIVLLYQDGCRDVADKAAAELLKTFPDKVEVLQLAAEIDTAWPAAPSWDDLLIVIFNGKDFPAPGNRSIKKRSWSNYRPRSGDRSRLRSRTGS